MSLASIIRLASAVLVLLLFGQFYCFDKGRILNGLVENVIVFVFTNFQYTILYSFQNLSLEFILKIFIKSRKIRP